MTYAKVINGEIVENNRVLPFSNSTTSFGIGATTNEMATYGYYPIIGTEPTYDRTTHRNNGTSYSFDGTQVNKIYDIQPIPLDELKANKIQSIKDTTNLSVPIAIGAVTYNGGESSASAIMGGINLANLNLETTIQIWDINNNVATYSIADAMNIVKAIALDYRTRVLARQTRITAVNAIVIDPQGIYPDYASAKVALDLI